MTPTKVIRRLIDVAPPIIAENARVPNRCVLATAIGVATLARFGIEAAPLAVSVRLANAAYMRWLEEGEPGGADEAVRRGAFVLDTSAGRLGPAGLSVMEITGRAWNRHLVILVPDRECVIDLDAQQLNRAERGVHVPSALVLNWPRGELERTWPIGASCLYLRAEPQDRSFEAATDWQVFPEIVGRVERAIRKGR